MTTKQILTQLTQIQNDVHELKTGQKLLEKDLFILRTNHFHHIQSSLQNLWRFSLIVGFFILVMFVDEIQTIFIDYIIK